MCIYIYVRVCFNALINIYYMKATILAILGKWLSVHLRTKWLWVQFPLLPLKTSDIAPVSSEEYLDIQANVESRFTLKRVHDMIITYSQYLLSLKVYIHDLFI